MLIEVLISSLLVALIAIATFNGFDVTQKVTQDERAHNEATTLAQQDEERLRGMPVSELELVGTKTRTVTEGTAAYTITSTAQFVTVGSNNEDELTCTAEKGSANYIQTTSSVTWSALGKQRKTVSQSSNVRVPTSTSLKVSVLNRNNEGVSGAKVEVFDPKTASVRTAEATTSSSGCVTFGGLAEGEAKIVVSNGEWIDHSGNKTPEKTVSITKTLAEAKFTLESPGAMRAEFTTNGLEHSISSFTFFTLQTELASPPDYVGGIASTATTNSTLTNLFPFVTPGKPWKENRYTVYAGDCEKNNPVEVSGGEIKEAPSVQLEPGQTKSIKVEAPEIKLTALDGSSSGAPGNPFTSTSAKVNNIECKTAAAQNYKIVPYEHEVKIVNGALTTPYLPYAKQLELCAVEYVESSKKYFKNTMTFTNTKKAGTEVKFYLKSTSPTKYTESLTALSC
ncbi:MAG TPA: carboxypeptidase-like regulatory domain-containing protein [Solirubrobacteraceae bacterium]